MRTLRRNSFTSLLSLAVLLSSMVAGVTYVKNQQDIRRSSALVGGPSLYFQPASKSVASGATNQTYDIYMNTNGYGVTAAIIDLSYNSNHLVVTAINPGTALPVNLGTNVTSSTARLEIGAQPSVPPAPFNGTGKVGSITFNARSVNTSTTITFTANTAVAAVGQATNVVGTMTNGIIVIGNTLTATPTPTLRPTNTVTPTPQFTTPTPLPTTRANLYFSPASKTVAAGTTGLAYDVFINTNGLSVSAASLEVSFNSNVLQVTDFIAGTALPNRLASTIGTTTAKIDIGSGPTTPFNGTGKVATLIFNSRNVGATTDINFTANTVVAAIGQTTNVAGTLTGGTVVVNAALTQTPTPTRILTPTPTRLPTPTPTRIPTPTDPPTTGGTILNVTADTYSSSGYPNSNYSTSNVVVASDYDATNIKRAFLKFHTGNIRLTSAELKLKVALSRGVSKRFYVTNALWDESTLTYNKKPSLGLQIGSYNHLVPYLQVGQVISIPLDATKLIPNENGDISIAISNSGDQNTLSFYSKESGSPAQLVINGTSTVPTATSTPVPTSTPTRIPTVTPTPTRIPTPTPTTSVPTPTSVNTPTPIIATNTPTATPAGPTPTLPPTQGVIYEAELALLQSAAVLNTHEGYSGTGYVDFVLNSGSRIVWYNVANPTAGSRTIGFRYSLGGFSQERSVSLLLNGRYLGNISFENTGDWNNWATKYLNLNLAGGTNIIELVTIGFDGPDIDYLEANTGTQPTISVVPATNTPTVPPTQTPTTVITATNTPTPRPTATNAPTTTFAPTATLTPTGANTPSPIPGEIGDADLDGDVDDDDYVILSGNISTNNNSGPADFNHDGVIDGVDYIIWLITYGF